MGNTMKVDPTTVMAQLESMLRLVQRACDSADPATPGEVHRDRKSVV